MALSDPTQALIVVPQKLAIQTIGTSSDLEELLALTKKGTYQYSKNICINHLNETLRQYFLKKSTQVYLEKEYNVLIKVNGNYKEDISEEIYGNDIDVFLNSGKMNSMPKNKIPLHLSIKGNNMMELDTALNSIKEMFNCSLTVQIISPMFENDNDYNIFYNMILGKDRVNIDYIESHTQTKLSVLGKGSTEENNDSSLPLHIVIKGVVPIGLIKSKKLCDSLIETIKSKWQRGKRL